MVWVFRVSLAGYVDRVERRHRRCVHACLKWLLYRNIGHVYHHSLIFVHEIEVFKSQTDLSTPSHHVDPESAGRTRRMLKARTDLSLIRILGILLTKDVDCKQDKERRAVAYRNCNVQISEAQRI